MKIYYFLFFIFYLELCLAPAEAKKFVKNYCKYHQLHRMAGSKEKKTKQVLNKLLEKRSQNFTLIEKQKYMAKRLDWFSRLREDTNHPMTEEEFDKLLRNLIQRPIRVTFRACSEVHTFRSQPKRYMFFYTYEDLIMEELDAIPELKEHVLGDKNFRFDPLFIESMQELNQVHFKMLSHLEKNSEIEFNSIWDMTDVFVDYLLNHINGRQPLSDPMRV